LPAHERDGSLIDRRGIPRPDGREVGFSRLVARTLIAGPPIVCYARENLNHRIRARAAPNGSGVNGPGGALVIRAVKARAAIASQKHSQKPSMYARTFDSRWTSAESDPKARPDAVAAP